MATYSEVNCDDKRTEVQLVDAKLPFWKKRRYHVAVMIFFGLVNVINLRINLSVAIVAMTERINITQDDGSIIEHQEFDWDSKQQGLILSSFFYGYIASQALAGILASRFGGHLIFGISLGATSVLALLIPIAAKAHFGLLLTVRILQGLFGGGIFPCITAIWAQWAPVYERTFLGNCSATGNYVGAIFAMLLSGIVIDALSWESVFYIFGAIGCICWIAWIFVVKANPEVDPFITEVEMKYIISSLGNQSKTKVKHPWKDILTSTAVWAIIVGHFVAMWGAFTLQTQMPMFFNDTLGLNVGKTGILAAIPYMVFTCLLFVSGRLADWVQVKGYFTTEQTRRYCSCGAFFIQMIFMLLTAFLTNPVLSVLCLCIGVGIGAFCWAGHIVNALDIAPSHASFIKGIGGTFGTLSGIVSPIVTGYIVTDKSREQWQIIFYIAAGLYLFGLIFLWFFTKGELQPWAKIDLQRQATRNTNEMTDNMTTSKDKL